MSKKRRVSTPNLIKVAELPEENQEFLVELDLLGGVWQICLDQGVGQQPSQALQDEAEVLEDEETKEQSAPLLIVSQECEEHSIGLVGLLSPPLCGFLTGSSQTGYQVLRAAEERTSLVRIFSHKTGILFKGFHPTYESMRIQTLPQR